MTAAWVNILDIPGLTYQVRVATSTYSFLGPTAGSVATPGVDYDIDGSNNVLVHSTATGDRSFAIYAHDSGGTLAGTPEYPVIAMRGIFDSTAVPNNAGFVYLHDAIKGNSTISGHQGQTVNTVTGANYVGTDLALGFYADGSFSSQQLIGAKFRLEVFVTLAPPVSAFWGDYVLSDETVASPNLLVKRTVRTLVPEQVGQQYLPASHDCYPIPPPPPPIVPPPGPPGGSGPPPGACFYVTVYASVVNCSGFPPGDPHARPPCTLEEIPVGTIEVCP